MHKPTFGVSVLLIVSTLNVCFMALTYERLAASVVDGWSGVAT